MFTTQTYLVGPPQYSIYSMAAVLKEALRHQLQALYLQATSNVIKLRTLFYYLNESWNKHVF